MSSIALSSSSLNSVSQADLLEAFADFLAIDVSAGDAATDTLITYRRQLQQFLLWCESCTLDPAQITGEHIKRYRRWLIDSRKLKPATVALKLSVVRRFYQAAQERGLINTNPAAGISPPKPKRDTTANINYLEKEEVTTLLAAIPDDHSLKAARDKALIAIMALEGPRTVELHRANIEDVVKQGSNYGIRVEGKRSIRIVPLTPDLANVLLNYLTLRTEAGERLKPSSPLFIAVGNRAKNQRISRRGIRLIVDSYLNETALKYMPGRVISTHSLRHTAGTLALRSGAELRQVQDLLGHADPRTTAIYAHVADRWESNPALNVDIDL
ncbi:MAG: tyrosine-type recombinase/integrase [Snowella sp.]|nr:tyrosine-type recombinase/integrase [Snowella sp.]